MTLEQRFAIPTYYDTDIDETAPDSPWQKIKRAGDIVEFVVVNPASGPGYLPEYINGSKRDKFRNIMAVMHDPSLPLVSVLGYVTTNYADFDPLDEGNTVQCEFHFTVDMHSNVVTTRNDEGMKAMTGWWKGFGPIKVRPDEDRNPVPALPEPLTATDEYYWIEESETTGKFARSEDDAQADKAIDLTSEGSEGSANYCVGLARTLRNVKFEIDQYYERWPDLDGMFLDEMNSGLKRGLTEDQKQEIVDYYAEVREHIKTKEGMALVVQNPGGNFDEGLQGVADIFLSCERSADKYGTYERLPWMIESQAPQKFWHAIHSCDREDMPNVIAASRSHEVAYIYVTDGASNPWLDLASYFETEVEDVKKRNSTKF